MSSQQLSSNGWPESVKVHPVWGSYCSHHGYGHRVMCPGCATPSPHREPKS